MPTDTRERILRALRHLLATGGTDAVTLEAVAAQAGVSKGGLLYHFPSKAALYAGLLDAVRDSVRREMAEATERSGAARGFLEYSEPTEDDEAGFFTSLIAAVRTGSSAEAGTGTETDGVGPGEQLVEIFREWEDPMRAAVPDPVQAEIIRLVGYGLYFGALAGLPPVPDTLLTQVFDRVLDEPS
ncbi:TetR family transcriptional regulator [Nakamurella sp. YIM 132087]|uniref:TetR family transcriptional regulator n=1 Tax=Nakamurella alba TaxID=2665158 RepID=A0A7K1FTB2_9ACTN|nr:TetR/AcrR family transcriptional regulator [Nakamurella alba]MTD17397.1 TetR family transcriptional regulator [Nakamurella alba]